VVGNGIPVDIIAAPARGAMSNDDMTIEDEIPEEELSEDELADEDVPDELFDDDAVDDDVLLDDDDGGVDEVDDTDDDDDGDGETEALDDLEAEELEMLTDDEASETIVVDEETQLRDIRRAQIAMESGVPGGPTEKEFVCSSCFLVKRSSQMAGRRKKICLDCAD
jgi:hypothetical protein